MFGVQARFPRDAVAISGDSRAYVRVGDAGSEVTFHFCPACGATVFYAVAGYDDGRIAIPVGAFADPQFPAPTVSVYEARRHSWVGLPANIDRPDS